MANHFFCPNQECEHHKQDLPDENWYTTNGYYFTKAFGLVSRYKCLSCGRGFSTQTFTLDYYAKKIVDYERIQSEVVSSSNNRAAARNMVVSPGTFANRVERLARQCIAFHAGQLSTIHLNENLAADGFESFCMSQYFPNNINLLIGEDSQFVYAFNYVLLRRKGRMTDKQKTRREELDKIVHYPQKGIEKAFREILSNVKELMEKRVKASIVLNTDKKLEYQRALKRIHFFSGEAASGGFAHNRVSSRKARTSDNPLFPVNYMDREIRKDLANHTRETVCFARNVNNMLNRMMIYFHWHNYRKPFRIGKKEEGRFQHGEKAGLDRSEYERQIGELYKHRRFLSFSKGVRRFWRMLWKKMFVTPLKVGREYLPQYALV